MAELSTPQVLTLVTVGLFAAIRIWIRIARFRLSGPVTTTYPNRQKKDEGHYQHGKKSGEWLHFDDNGNRLSQEFYVGGKLHGKATRWGSEGGLSNEIEYAHGKRHGRYVNYFPQGSISDEGEFYLGKKHGTWRNYGINSSGQTRLESLERYDKGKRISVRYFD